MSTAPLPADDRKFPPGSALLLFVLVTAEVTISSDFSLTSIALPSIQRGLMLPPMVAQWVITADILAYAGMLIVAGRTADVFGQKRTLEAGLTIFLTGTLLTSLSSGAPMLIVARIMQGIGGAFTYPAAFSLLTISFREGPQRFRAYTLSMAAASAGIPLITLLVGWLVTRFGWQSAFLFNVPMCLVVLVGLRFISLAPHVRQVGRVSIPIVNAVLLSAGVAALVYALTSLVARHPGTTSRSAIALVAGFAILAVFGLMERRGKTALIPYGLFTLQNFTAGIASIAFAVLTGKALILLSNLSLQQGLGFTPFAASLTLLPMVVSSLMVVPLSAALDRILLPYAKWVNCAAFATIGLFYLVLSRTDGQWAYPTLAIVAFLSPFVSLVNANLSLNAALRNVPREIQGVATAMTYTAVQIVTATGVAIVITVADRSGGEAAGFGMFGNSFLIGGAFCVAGMLVAALALRPTIARSVAPGAKRLDTAV